MSVVVDSHTHIVSKDVATYPLFEVELPESLEWRTEVAQPVEGMLDLMDGAGVDRIVLVQALAAHGYDNRYVIDSARAHTDRAVGIGGVNIAEHGPAEVRQLVEQEGLSGVRLFAVGGGSAALRSERTLPLVQAAAAVGAPVLLLTGADNIPVVGTLAAQVPDAALVFDHCGLPDITSGAPWPGADPLFALVDHPNVYLKVTPYLFEHVTTDAAAAFLAELVDRFGAGRLMWGSDFPHSHERPYAGLLDFAKEIVAPLPVTDQDRILGGTAVSLWPTLGD